MVKRDSVSSKLKALRERAGLSMAQLAKAIGYRGPSSYQRYEDPTLFTKSELPLPLARNLADVLAGKGSPPITREEVLLLAGISDLTAPQMRALDEHSWIWCVGEASAGRWRESFEWPRDEWIPIALAVKDMRYPTAKRSALKVNGDSMDELYPDGSYVIFVRLSDVGGKPQQGDKVVVARYRQDLMEATIKEYTRDTKGQRWLVPRSSNPAHTAVRLDVGEGEHVEILGLIVGSQKLE